MSDEIGGTSNASLTTRLWNPRLNSATVLSTREDADVTLNTPRGKRIVRKRIRIPRHRMLGSMFSHNTNECQIGEVKIQDTGLSSDNTKDVYRKGCEQTPGGKRIVRKRIRIPRLKCEIGEVKIHDTGHPRGLSSDKTKDVNGISQKYDLRDLKYCSEFLRVGLSVETFCDVVTSANLYQDKKLMDCAKGYFVRHKDEIIKSDQWKALKEANAQIALEMLE